MDQVYEESILAVVAQNVLTQVPLKNGDNKLSADFGRITFEDLDRSKVGPNKGLSIFGSLIQIQLPTLFGFFFISKLFLKLF